MQQHHGARRRILFHGLPAYGHLYPLLPLAEAARSAGHDVVFATGPSFVDRLSSYGFSARPAGVGPLEVAAEIFDGPVPRRSDGRANAEAQTRIFLDALPRRTTGELRAVFSDIAPDVVVYEHTAVGAALAAAAEGVPAISVGIVAGATVDVFDPPQSPTFGELLAAHGLTSVADLRPVRFLDPFPDALRTGPASRWAPSPLRPVAWRNPTGTTPRWLAEARRPVVYLTLGTIFGSSAVLGQALDGLLRLGVDVLVAPGSVPAAELGALPDRVHVEGFVDQARILPLVDVVVHHGGSGTTLGAAGVGLPQVILPSGADQHANGEAVARSLAGLLLEPTEVTPARVAGAVSRLLDDPACTAAAQRIRRQIAGMPSPTDVLADALADALTDALTDSTTTVAAA